MSQSIRLSDLNIDENVALDLLPKVSAPKMTSEYCAKWLMLLVAEHQQIMELAKHLKI